MELLKYDSCMKAEWDEFIDNSKNGSFMFCRDFMEYHSHRFVDHSLVFRSEKRKIIAVVPANVRDDGFYTHQGLTYGGIISDHNMTCTKMESVVDQLLSYLRKIGLARLLYKAMPYIYHQGPADEDLYVLFQRGAVLSKRMVSSTIDYRRTFPLQERRKRGVSKAIKIGVTVDESTDYRPFWEILSANLSQRHNTQPVHSLAEMEMLSQRFPEAIRLFIAEKQGFVVAGVVVFENPTIVHLQYISANDEGKSSGALDLLIATVIEKYQAEKWYFDFGISTEDGGKILNHGLIEQKEGFGARSVNYDHYYLEL